MGIVIEEKGGRIEFVAKIIPGSSRTALAGELGHMARIKVASPPEKGKANKCLIDFLSQLLSVKKTDIKIVSGKTNPVKHIAVTGTGIDEVKKALA